MADGRGNSIAPVNECRKKYFETGYKIIGSMAIEIREFKNKIGGAKDGTRKDIFL